MLSKRRTNNRIRRMVRCYYFDGGICYSEIPAEYQEKWNALCRKIGRPTREDFERFKKTIKRQ